jgi:nicotinamide mononucleotide transporter
MPLSLTELLGFLTGAACVWLLARQNIWNWPLGIANGIFYVVVFVRSGLYGDAGLQLVYIALNAYGWYVWLRPGTATSELAVTRTPRQTWLWMLPSMGVAALLLARFLATYTDSTVPQWDGLTTSISLAAIYGQSKKLVESWWLWIVADLIYIPLYLYKSLWLTSILYGIFLILCIVGLRSWMGALRTTDESKTAPCGHGSGTLENR